MNPIGFSTGALGKADLARGVSGARGLGLEVIELSALRQRELDPLVAFVKSHDLGSFDYISVHAPTDYATEQEPHVARTLQVLAEHHAWSVVVHPDCFGDDELWRPFGRLLCIENMDKRKTVGRTVEELEPLFRRFPEATLCFDIAHAHQVDPSMTEAYRILRVFGHRISQLHVSEVTSSSKHERLSDTVVESFREVASLLPRHVPIILESPVAPGEAEGELQQAARIFEPAAARRQAAHA